MSASDGKPTKLKRAPNGSQKSNKDETYWRILNLAISLDVQTGHQKWKITDLSRRSGISRALIYYYFGKSKEGILLEACRWFGDFIAGVTPEKVANWERGDLAASFLASRELIARCPAMVSFYLLNRDKKSATGTALRKAENDYRKKIQNFFPQRSPAEIDAAFALSFGLTFFPQNTPEGVRVGLTWLLKGLGRLFSVGGG